jgi:beta-1,4-mannosyl-glycoprotein beta-1,4-N-acetylglucosaminyltransferase
MTKIYDCFLFSYNPDILEIRLNILDEVVDYFVIIEGDHNFNGLPRDFVFTKEENLKRFEKFLHKIIYVTITDMPQHRVSEVSDAETEAWKLENFLRNSIVRGLSTAEDDDIIVVSDFDEIPDPKILKQIKKEKNKDVILLSHSHFFYKLNSLIVNVDKKMTSSVVFNKKMLEKYNPNDLRIKFREANIKNKDSLDGVGFDVIYNAGWHFSWVGDKEYINEKLDGYPHQEHRNEKGRKYKEDQASLRDSHSEYGDTPSDGDTVNIVLDSFFTVNIVLDSFLPDYILKNQEKYANIISKKVSNKSGYDFINKSG